MANTQKYGFRLVASRGIAPKPEPFRVASAYSGSEGGITIDLNVGDPVKMLSTGYVAHADAGDLILGVVAGIGPLLSTSLRCPWDTKLPAGTVQASPNEPVIYVQPAANALFEVDCDDAVTATTYAGYVAFIGENCDHSWSGVSATAKGWPMLDISDHKAASAGWRIVDIQKRIDQDYASVYVKLIVTANEVFQAPYYTSGV